MRATILPLAIILTDAHRGTFYEGSLILHVDFKKA